MRVREAKPSDAGQIATLWNAVITDTLLTFTSATKSIPGLEQDITTRGSAFLVLEQDEKVLGFATFFQFRGGPGYARTMEHSIILAPEVQGTGQGKRLMTALEAEARRRAVHSLWAGVSSANPSGVQFHQKIGFQFVARLPEVGFKFDRWLDLILLQKIL